MLTLTACSGASPRLHPAHQTPRIVLTSASASPTPPPASGDDGFDDGGDDGPAQLTPSLQLSITPSVRAAVTAQGQADAVIAPINTPATGEVIVTFGRQGIEEVDVTITGPNFNHTAHIGPGGNPDFTLTLPSQYGDATYTATATVNGQQVSDHKTVQVFKAEGKKNGGWSADDDRHAFIVNLIGFEPNYGTNTDFPNGGHEAGVELELKIKPAGLHLDLPHFNIKNRYIVTETYTLQDGTQGIKAQDQIPREDPLFPAGANGNIDADNPDGDTINFVDAPGASQAASTQIKQKFDANPTWKSYHLHFDFTTTPLYLSGEDKFEVGTPFTWSVDITATKQADGTITWS